MNNKMAINTCLSTIEFKKQTKQTKTETESCIWKYFDGGQMGGAYGEMSEEVRGLRSKIRHLQNRHGM